MNEDNFDFFQYPSFFEDFSDLEDGALSDLDYEPEDGIIECPFLPLRDLVLYPQMVMPLFIGRDRSLAAVQAAVANDERLVLATQRQVEQTDPLPDEIFSLGTETSINRFLRLPDQSNSVLVQGRRRVEILEYVQWDPYIRVRARLIAEEDGWNEETEALMRTAVDIYEKVVMLSRKIPDDAFAFAINIDEPGWLADFIASTLDSPVEVKQSILETLDSSTRLHKVTILLAKELDVLQLEDQIHSKVQKEIDKTQREHFLREQMRAIQGELGEMDVFSQEIDELRHSLKRKQLPDEVRAKAEKELIRLASMPSMAPEVGIIRTYLDWLVDLPWTEASEESLDVIHAAEILDADHYGLETIKDRILEHIAARQLAPDRVRAPILCFVGPPGTGKTSLGRSIARALNREFVRISLGGVRDEAEIRGHRRTYIGAMPGRIIQAMRRSGTCNPLFMLDEIDKIGQDFRGDPSAALLEVLDPEQNNTFADHYLDLDFDLSNVMFITTANILDPVPMPLRDRMEIIEFRSYLEEEKIEIARAFLIPRQLENHGLRQAGLRFEESAIQVLIRQYTYEAGVRNLERELANVCRKVARRVAEKKRYPKRLTANQVIELLGPPMMTDRHLREEDEVGVANGMAWTATGGDVMYIEVNLMSGKGDLMLTGQLGDVMRESARAALTFTRSQAEVLGIDPLEFERTDIHIHIPEGAVPKDGPSAGVPLVSAIVSAFTGRPIRRDIGMTGEITLRGRVLPVGGIREKALAARRLGIQDFVLPQKNENDIQRIPKNLRKDLNFIKVDHINQVLQVVFR
ncbi:MAG: endopeptidase La [Ardenticatenaceae bacterium]|nr:endopeptidase La [Ardenticatenaceae bacterium]